MDLAKIAEVALRAGLYFFHRRHQNLTPECSPCSENAGGDSSILLPGAAGGNKSVLLSEPAGGDNSHLVSEAAGGANSNLVSEAAGGANSNLVSEAADSNKWRDKKKFFQLIEFSYDLSLNVVRAFIESNILKDYNNSLENFLNKHKHAIYHLWIFNTRCCIGTCTLNQNRELRKDQLTKLYDLPVTGTTGHYKKGRGNSVIQCCSCGINVRNICSLKDLDIILIHTIIRHCVNLQPDEDMWLNTIRDIRNKLAHVESTTGFDEGRLDRWWQKLEGSVLGLAGKTPSFYYNTIESQVNRLKKCDFDSTYIQEILGKLKAENKQFHDDITRDIRQVSRFLTDELIQHIKEVKDIVVDIRNLSFKVAPPGPPRLQIQNLNSTESCDIQDSNICYVQWKLDTPDSWQVQQIKDTLESVSAMLHLWFKVEFVYIGSLIIVTTVPKHVIMDKQSFEEAVRAFLEKFVEVCGIDTNSPATVHVELTLLQDFNDLSTGDKDEDNLHSNVPPVVQEDKKVTEVGFPITPVTSQESSKTKESQGENTQKDESDEKKPPERSHSSVLDVYDFSPASPASTESKTFMYQRSQDSSMSYESQQSLETDAAPLTPRLRVPDLLRNIDTPLETEEEIRQGEQSLSFQEAMPRSGHPVSEARHHLYYIGSDRDHTEVNVLTGENRQLQLLTDFEDLSIHDKQSKDDKSCSEDPPISRSVSMPQYDAEPYTGSGDKKEDTEEPLADGVILHAEDDRDNAIEFIKNMESENPDLNLDILIYEELRGDRFLLSSAADLFDSCIYLFILMSKNFKKSDLERFQGEIALIESITNPMRNCRVIPVAMDNECRLPELRPLIPLRYEKYLEGKSKNRKDKPFLNTFQMLIKVGRQKYLPC